jgi:hypothetical protein
MNPWVFIRSVSKHLWPLLSCAAFTILGVYGAYSGWTSDWIIKGSLALAGLFLIVACYQTWLAEHRLVSSRDQHIAQIEEKYLDDRPRLQFVATSVSGRQSWDRTVGAGESPATFTLQHLSGRAATSVRIDPIPSLLGRFSLRFEDCPVINDPEPRVLKYEIWEQDVRPHDKVIESIGWGSLLPPFLGDSPLAQVERNYDVTVRFKDNGVERSQAFSFRYNIPRCLLEMSDQRA